MRIWRPRSNEIWLGGLLLSSLLFWALRILYWSSNVEEPFSDMYGYVQTADNIVNHFFFGKETKFPGYYTPVTPIIIAIAKLISADQFIWIFRMMVQLIAFGGLLALTRELALVTGRKWLGLALLFVAAISRPSIFWSLKIATEPVCEALLYVAAALALATVRTRSVWLAVACGIACLAFGLNRPNFLPGAALVPLAFLMSGIFAWPAWRTAAIEAPARAIGLRKYVRYCDRRTLALVGVFAIGFLGTWGLWIGRNIVNYKMFLPTSVSGYVTMNWDYAGGPIRSGRYNSLTLADGRTWSIFEIGKLIIFADSIPIERERAKFYRLVSNAWFSANWMDFPELFALRLKHMVAFRGPNGLTKVSREDLFPAPTPGYNNPYTQTGWLNLVLLDKTPTVCFLGLLGLLFIVRRAPALSPIFLGVALMPWLCAALVIGYERSVESLIPLTIWFALYGLAELVLVLRAIQGDSLSPVR